MPVYFSPFPKPKMGAACNGCGYCCAVHPCQIAVEFLASASTGACPALEVDTSTGGTACGMIRRPLHYLLGNGRQRMVDEADKAQFQKHQTELGAEFAHELGAGRGCDSTDTDRSKHWPWPVMLSEAL